MSDISLNVLAKHHFDVFAEKVFCELNPNTTFMANWHHQAISYQITKCINGTNTRLMISVPPRSGKTIYGSIAAAAWSLGRNPSLKIIFVSYADDLIKNNMRDLKQTLQSDWFNKIFPGCKLSPKKNTETQIITNQNGGVYATTVGGALTGIGGDLIIIDDAMKPAEMFSETLRSKTNEWYKSTLVTRLNNKKSGKIIIIMQRLHPDDLIGHLLPLDHWEHLNLPAICDQTRNIRISDNTKYLWTDGEELHPEREDLNLLQKLKKTMGTLKFSAQYLQQPMPTEGNMINPEWFGSYTPAPDFCPDDFVQVWDTATGTGENHDYSVCLTFGLIDHKALLSNIFRGKLLYPDLRDEAIRLANHFKPKTIVIETSNVGYSLIPDLRNDTKFQILPAHSKHSKEERLATVSHLIQQGIVQLPKIDGKWPDSIQKFLDELSAFPNVANDDMVDATSLFLRWYIKQGPGCLGKDPGGFCLYSDGNIKHY